MMVRLTVWFAAVAVALGDISATSRLGSRLLSKARLLNNGDDAYDFTWIQNYAIKFDSCHNQLSFRADAGREEEDGDGSPAEIQRVVLFKLCPSDACGSCRGGATYLIEMREFVESWLDSKQTQQELNCENVEENCACDEDDANDDEACLAQCYVDAGLDYCEDEEDNDDEEFEIDRYLECEGIEGQDDDSNQLYVGAYCSSNGKGIYLGVFGDRQCSNRVSTDNFYSLTGIELPYTSTSIIDSECINCMEPSEYDDDYNADANDEDSVLEICEELYEKSAKCESNLDNPNGQITSGCDYINKVLPRVEALANGTTSKSTIFAWIFFATTLMSLGYAFILYRKLSKQQKTGLADKDGLSSTE